MSPRARVVAIDADGAHIPGAFVAGTVSGEPARQWRSCTTGASVLRAAGHCRARCRATWSFAVDAVVVGTASPAARRALFASDGAAGLLSALQVTGDPYDAIGV
ncbi:MAG: hypothetical protein R3F59_35890 [Myxococcota bacterium]